MNLPERISNSASSPNLVSKTKIITNPLLKKLFNRDRISVTGDGNEKIIQTTTRPPTLRTTTARERRPFVVRTQPTTVRTVQSRPTTTRRTTTTKFLKTFTTTPASTPRMQPQVQVKQQQSTTLFDRIKNRINDEKQEKQKSESPIARKPTEKELMNALIQRRVEEELARRRDQDQQRIETERRKLLDQANKRENEERKSRLVALVSEAREAVSRRLASHTDKSSPAVWAAVRALRNFISSRQEGGQSGQTGESREKVPEKVVRAVRQLTRFLSEDESLSQEEEEGSLQEIQTFMRSEGAEEPDVFLPNIEIKKLPQKQSDSDLQFPLLSQFGRELDQKKVTLNVPGSRIRPVPDSSDIVSTFRFSTLPV